MLLLKKAIFEAALIILISKIIETETVKNARKIVREYLYEFVIFIKNLYWVIRVS